MRGLPAALAVTAITVALTATAGARTSGSAFGTPVKVNTTGFGYEPSIDTDAAGTLYVTAHKGSVTNEGTRLSSFLWSSHDKGASWHELAAPPHATDGEFSFEGDIAVDRRGRLYFVDTYGADNWLSRWTKTGELDRSAPAVTTSVFDDRPWIATQGDDVVWLLTTDIATHATANGVPDPAAGSGGAQSQVLYRSTDGGVTWSTGSAFPNAQYCGLATAPTDDRLLAVACVGRTDGGQRVVVYRSADAGATWSEQPVYTYRGRADSFLSIAFDRGGTLVTSFAEAGDKGHRLYAANSTSRGWTVRDITPFRGAFQHVWVAANGNGKVGLAFYGTASPTPTATSDWYVYGGVATGGRWSISRADVRPVLRAPYAPADFLQCVFTPDSRLHIAYSKSTTTDALHAPPPDFDHDIYVVSER
jgi:hypothetical protein